MGFSGGFSMIELLVALAIGAAVLTAGVMIFQNLTVGAKSSGTYLNVTLGTDTLTAFYGMNQTALDVWVAPNYGRRIAADELKDQFFADVGRSTAVYCLGRAGGVRNENHPTTISVPAGFDGRSLDLPDAFRLQLEASLAATIGVFTAYRGTSNAPNLTIFLLQPSAEIDELSVLAIYEVDLITTSTPPGTYASVRRYVGDTLTGYYDVFYQNSSAVAFSPMAVCFERQARTSLVEGSALDRLKVAAERPFYFVWWPDPAMPALTPQAGGGFATADPRAAYANMGGQTGLFFVVPMFPSL